MRLTLIIPIAIVSAATAVPASLEAEQDRRSEILARARVWTQTNTASKDLRRGPVRPDGFRPGQVVNCEYLDKQLAGRSPKFACLIGQKDEVKVKYGGTNGEVYGEVAAARLLWALGFAADHMYPVRVICRGCPPEVGGIERADGDRILDPAVIERKVRGREITRNGEEGWAWEELDAVSEEAGGAPKAHRDALTLLAVVLQHTDSKPQQQRLFCQGEEDEGPCARPFLMINDLGLTFGRANRTNANLEGSVNLRGWAETPVWKGAQGCVGNLPKSLTGSLEDPVISEDGRRFLATLLMRLSDAQLRDLFEGARFHLRPRDPERGRSGFPTSQEWVDAFKKKRDEIVQRRCA